MKIIQIIDHHTFGDRCVEIAKASAPYADMIWFRIKDPSLVYAEAEKMRKALPDSFLTLSLDAETAAALGYQAVQLGRGAEIQAVRQKYPNLRLGYSAHSADEIMSTDADFYTLSPIFFTQKDYEVKPLGVLDVSDMRREIYALGGVTSANVHQIAGHGYSGIAGISFYKELEKLKTLAM